MSSEPAGSEQGRRTKVIKAWADFGSHGYIFEFCTGPVAERYPNLLQVYSKPQKGLIPVEIHVVQERKK